MLTCQRYVIHTTEELRLTQRKQMTCLSSRREVAELLGIYKKCPHAFCPSKQILLEEEVGERKGLLVLPFASAKNREALKNK